MVYCGNTTVIICEAFRRTAHLPLQDSITDGIRVTHPVPIRIKCFGGTILSLLSSCTAQSRGLLHRGLGRVKRDWCENCFHDAHHISGSI